MSDKEKNDEIGRLYLLCEQVLEPMTLEIEKKLEELDIEKDKSEVQQLLPRLLYYRKKIELIHDRISVLRKDNFAFSIEEIYHMFGRYDKFISIDFHHDSESARQYGRTIMGTPIYNRREREDIENSIRSNEISRTNGRVKFEVSPLCHLSDDDSRKLKREGFLSGDVFSIHHTQIDFQDSYNQKGKKEIPGTINIEIPYDEQLNVELGFLTLYRNRVADGSKPLIDQEWNEYFAYKILYDKDNISADEWERIHEKDSKIIREDIRFYLLRSKIRRKMQLSLDERADLSAIFERRRKERYRLVDKEINRSANKKLKEIIASEKELYAEIKREALSYETMNLSPYGSKIPIWLDLERYLHIFLRHCEDFQIGDWKNGGKLAFPYSFKDMKRLLEIAVKELMPEIENKLREGKEFSIFDKRGYYFNGNYYVIHIGKNGRLLSFYPHKNPE
ncbi:MAG: hypothetical protein KDD15_26305 [Lewinella sp.]|nr:hypothetical protein [Lewinella sp.]